jgi:hypothetical protein
MRDGVASRTEGSNKFVSRNGAKWLIWNSDSKARIAIADARGEDAHRGQRREIDRFGLDLRSRNTGFEPRSVFGQALRAARRYNHFGAMLRQTESGILTDPA